MGAAGGSTVLQCEVHSATALWVVYFRGVYFKIFYMSLQIFYPLLMSESPWEDLT